MLYVFESNEGNWANIIVLLSVELQLGQSGLPCVSCFLSECVTNVYCSGSLFVVTGAKASRYDPLHDVKSMDRILSCFCIKNRPVWWCSRHRHEYPLGVFKIPFPIDAGRFPVRRPTQYNESELCGQRNLRSTFSFVFVLYNGL